MSDIRSRAIPPIRPLSAEDQRSAEEAQASKGVGPEIGAKDTVSTGGSAPESTFKGRATANPRPANTDQAPS